MKIGILVHGAHLQAKEWDTLVWGVAPSQMGRLPKAIQILLSFGASVIFFGTGASEKDGFKEGEYAFKTLLERQENLSKFDALKELPSINTLEVSLSEIKEGGRLAEVIVDAVSQNTKEELLVAGDIFVARGVTHVFLVSSATHIARCLRDAQSVYNNPLYGGKYKALAQGLMGAPADTCYAGADYDSTVIVEAPHRGDRVAYPLHEKVKEIFSVKPDKLEAFGEELSFLVKKYC